MTFTEEELKDKDNIKPLTPLQVRQLEYLCKDYPHLPQDVLETVLRLTEDQRCKLVQDIKDGKQEVHEERKDPEYYSRTSVSVE